MRLQQYLNEKRKNNIIVCDVQPIYKSYIRFNIYKFMEFLNNGLKILLLFNGPDTIGGDSKNKIINEYYEYGLNENKFEDFKWVDKGYGFLRSWMDSGISDRDIIKSIRFLLSNKVYDSRDISAEKWEEEIDNIWSYVDYDDPLYLPHEIRIDKLKKWSGSYLVGGGKNECLKELQLLMSAFNIKYKVVKEFIY